MIPADSKDWQSSGLLTVIKKEFQCVLCHILSITSLSQVYHRLKNLLQWSRIDFGK